MMRLTCSLCPHQCQLAPDGVGLCRGRANRDGEIKAINYGLVTALALDPIRKKPLYHFFPDSIILSVGSFGCNLRCPFCQNHQISTVGQADVVTRSLFPKQLVEMAVTLKEQGNIGIAFTYNEPLIGYEYVYDTAKLGQKYGLKNVLVSNGYCCEEPLRDLLPLIDGINFDLKAFNDQFYQKIGGDLETVKRSIALAANQTHLEVTTLIIPGENDSLAEIKALSRWLASIRRDIPLHLNCFIPRYQYRDRSKTKVEHLQQLAAIARVELDYVYLGNC